jgi:hypothetical protein
MTDRDRHGIVNGGHTYAAIRDAIETADEIARKSLSRAYVRLHILQGLAEEKVAEIAEGLNRTKVDDPSLADLQGHFSKPPACGECGGLQRPWDAPLVHRRHVRPCTHKIRLGGHVGVFSWRNSQSRQPQRSHAQRKKPSWYCVSGMRLWPNSAQIIPVQRALIQSIICRNPSAGSYSIAQVEVAGALISYQPFRGILNRKACV